MTVLRAGAWGVWQRGVRLAGARLRVRATIALTLVTLGAVAATALVLRARAPLTAPSQTLGVVFRWVVPLGAFALCSLCLGRARLDDSVWPIASQGAPRRHVVLGVLSVALATCATLAAATASLGLVLAYGHTPGLLEDLSTTAWIAALGGAAYAAWFTLGASFLRLGRGRWLPLLLDFTLGATGGVLALCWPRAHLNNLAGGESLLDLTQQTSSVLLAGVTAVVVIVAAMRGGD